MSHEVFRFKDRSGLERKIAELGLDLPLSDDISVLFQPLSLAGRTLPHRLVIHPMEGADATPDGHPSELTFRRYRRFGQSGAAIVWFEATAACGSGRSNPHQLWLRPQTLSSFGNLVEATRREARKKSEPGDTPLLILQLTHSGRFSKPEGRAVPICAQPNPILDAWMGLPSDYPLVGDDELDRIQDDFVAAASLARKAGFDGVDIKACHGYLLSELLAARKREKSRYGGSLENRARFLLETVKRIKQDVGGLLITSRINAVDGLPWPYGFGSSPREDTAEDLSELKFLMGKLSEVGIPLVSISLGIPAFNPHLGRPYNLPLLGQPLPGEHPLIGVARHIRLTAEAQRAFPGVAVLGAGYSWLRHFFPHAAAATLQTGKASLIGLGRFSLANPGWPEELAENGFLSSKKTCLACSRCSQLLRAGGPAGCAVRDVPLYAREYRRLRARIRGDRMESRERIIAEETKK